MRIEKNNEREYLTALSIEQGIIVLIDPEGEVTYRRQRGIKSIPNNKKAYLIRQGLLHPNWEAIPELPRNWSISFEDEEIMGKARAGYPYAK